MLKPTPLPGSGRSQEDDRGMANELQRLQASQFAGRHDA
jgi:hypothetical protein